MEPWLSTPLEAELSLELDRRKTCEAFDEAAEKAPEVLAVVTKQLYGAYAVQEALLRKATLRIAELEAEQWRWQTPYFVQWLPGWLLSLTPWRRPTRTVVTSEVRRWAEEIEDELIEKGLR